MKILTDPVNSAQLSAVTPYEVPGDFHPGEQNAVKIPIVNGTASVLENFKVNANGDLEYTGNRETEIRLTGLFSFGSIKPSQTFPGATLDVGPKATMWLYFKVAGKKGVASRFDQTIYLPDWQWPVTRYCLDLADTFTFRRGDVIEVFTYYDWTLPPQPPLNPATFYFNIKLASLAIAAFSNVDTEVPTGIPIFTKSEQVQAEIPLGDHVNKKVWTFKPGINGRVLIDVRLNILNEKAKLESGAIVPIFGSTWWTYVSINGVLQPQFLNFQTIANSPVLYNGSVFPSTQTFFLMADLKENDEVSVLAMHQFDCLVFTDTPPFFAFITRGSIVTDLQLHTIVSPALYTNGVLRMLSDSTVTIPLDTNLDNAIVLPWGEAKLDFPEQFRFRDGQLTYTGPQTRPFKIVADLNISSLELKTSDGDPVVIDIQTLGFAIGVNGQKYNLVRTESNVYSDTRYVLTLVCNQTTSNVITLSRNQNISILLYFFNSKYLDQPPAQGVPSKTPAPGSYINLKGSVSVSIESDAPGPQEVRVRVK